MSDRPNLVGALHHLAVKTTDLSRAEEFWVGALGLEVVRRQSDDAGPRSIWLSLGQGAFLALERAEVEGPTREDGCPGWHCAALKIEPHDRERWRVRLAERGWPVAHETAYTLYVRDPEGAVVALSHYPHAAIEAGVAEGTRQSEPPTEPGLASGPDAGDEPKQAGVTSRLAALVTLS